MTETIVILGASGSFGRAFIRHQLSDSYWDGRIVGVSRNDEKRYELEQRHLADVKAGRLLVVPGDVRQPFDLAELAGFGVTTVISAAAAKHVTTGERFAEYTWSVNYVGVLNALQFAAWCGASKFLLLSTDKATIGLQGEGPANVYGQTKRAAERAVVAAVCEHGRRCRFASTRYGNVIASSGSVLPLFLEQRKAGALSLTDARCTRFAMPIDDVGSNGAKVTMQDGTPVISAVGLVLQALAGMRGLGEIFVPAIPSHHVRDLARTVAPDATIEEVGIRPGERLHEVLISPCEACRTWARPEGGWVILPDAEMEWPGGARVSSDFHFSSDQRPLPVEWRETA